MKKLLFLLAAFLVLFTNCTAFDSDPVEPNIIGVGNLQYDVTNDIYYVQIDTISYTVEAITVPDRNPRSYSATQKISPVEGARVTIFNCKGNKRIRAVQGAQTVEQIEALYHENYTFLYALMAVVFILIIGLIIGLFVTEGTSYQ